jgi:hypothetical protein
MTEPKIGVNRGNAGKGRPPGAQNKLTAVAKDAIATAATELGGSDRLVAWAKEDPLNERAFWTTIYPKLIPVQVGGDPDGSPLLHKQIGKVVSEIVSART